MGLTEEKRGWLYQGKGCAWFYDTNFRFTGFPLFYFPRFFFFPLPLLPLLFQPGLILSLVGERGITGPVGRASYRQRAD